MQWVRNVSTNGEAALLKGRRRQRVRLRPVSDAAKPEILKAYLDRFTATVLRCFSVPAGSPAEVFAALASEYPVFEITAA